MSWLDTLLDRGNEARQLETQAPTAKPEPPVVGIPATEITGPRPAMTSGLPGPEIKHVWFQTRAPQNGDLGEIYPAWYSVADGVLTMHDETGKPTGEEYQLRAGEDPHMAAGRLGRNAWIKARGETDFNRPLGYARSGNA
jgi:hypothetical protein